jgi:cell shape-determining protein MreD
VAILIAIPLLISLFIVQLAILGNLHILHGSADLVMLAITAWALYGRSKFSWVWAVFGGLLVSYISATPFFAPLAGYLLITGLVQIIKWRVWQTPLLVMFVATIIGTVILHALYVLSMQITGSTLTWNQSFNQVTLPSILLNLVFSLPIYVLIKDLANWIYPTEVEE